VNLGGWFLWGFVATLAVSIVLDGSQVIGLTRMNLPYMMGSIFTPDRDRAKVYGFFSHMFNGWVFSLLYVLIFESLHRATWWLGATLGLGHALFLLAVLVPLMPGFHPRMASERHGPSANRMLEPPGFLALNYGWPTPISVIATHLVFGIILGSFYHLA
jgi:hypothetical protein